MTDKKKDSMKFVELRNKAEKLLQDREFDSSDYPSDLFDLMEELRVHQAELEVQNEELKNAQQEISELHHEYEDLYEFAPCVYITLSPKGIITLSNLRGVDLLGVERANLKAMALSVFVAQGSQNDYFSAFREARQSGEQQNTELELDRHDGKTVWVQANIQPKQNEEGSIEQWRLTLTDITERKLLEEEKNIIASEVSDLYENAPCGYHSLDKDGFFVRINATELTWLGYTRDEIIGKKKFVDLLSARSVETYKKNFPAYKERDYVYNLEFEMISKDGSILPVILNATAVKDESGNYLMSRSTIFDITDKNQREEDLQFQNVVLNTQLETSPDGILVVSKGDRINYFNQRFVDMWEIPDSVMATQSWKKLLQSVLDKVVDPEAFVNRIYHIYENRQDKCYDEIELTDGRIFERYTAPMFWHNKYYFGRVWYYHDITKRKRMEQSLRSERNISQHYLDTTQTMMVAMNVEGQITMINRSGRELLGYSEDEILGCNWFETCLPQPEGMDRVYPVFQTIMAGELAPVEYFENNVICRDGTQRLIGWHNSFLEDDAGRVVGLLSSGEDITDRRQAEEALRESEQQYRSLFENIRDAILLADTERRIFGCNPAFESLFGYTLEEIKGEKTSYVYEDEEEFQKLGNSISENINNSSFLMTVNYKKKDGEVFPGETGVFQLKDQYGNVTGFIGVIRDVTFRKQAEDRLQKAHDKLDTLVQLNADGLMVLNQEGSILFLNPAAAEMLGRDQDELLGEQFGYPHIPGSNTEIELLTTTGEARVVELRARETEWIGQAALLVSFRDMTERKQAEERIYNLAYYDDLTALPNRRLFYERLKQISAQSEHFGDGGVVFLLDITRLRDLNDTLGQEAGDELIREVARRINDSVFEEDTLARVSGGEFIVLSQGRSTADRAHNLGKRILERIGWNLELSGRRVYPEVNMGYTLFPQRATDPETLIKQADLALSEAKKSAYSIQEFAGQEDWISRLFHLEHDLKQALVNEEFYLCYQSQIDLRSGRIVGLEALLRWKHPQRGVVSPGEFIPVLEHTGMIPSADEWVIHRVCKQLKTWQDSGIFVKTSVNLSAQELSNDATLDVVWAALEKDGVRAENLEVEITETSLMQNVDRASWVLQTLSSWGVKVALDDFGKGYSSLSYLQQLAINIIKIDKQFVEGLPENQDSVALVHTIIAMAHNLGKEVLAEGVEREEQRQKLCELGCDYGQGFLWSRPQPVEKLSLMES